MATEQRQVHYSGSVQGVGFRFTACRLAVNYDVEGYVRNVPDGRVECVVEGDSEQIDGFLEDLRGAMSGYIRDQVQRTSPPSGNLGRFTIRY
jgi:acylphosphatase